MIFLSAQPDDFYFTWQLELQIYNFNRLGVSPDNIHILISYMPKRGVRDHFLQLMEQYKHKASFFAYPDKRENKKYAPSARPHIIQQHLEKFPFLQQASIFYHDSDIIFRELPNFSAMKEDNIWYVSDTRSYLDSTYIKRNSEEGFFDIMCATVGVTEGPGFDYYERYAAVATIILFNCENNVG